jgi:hypothetical protein
VNDTLSLAGESLRLTPRKVGAVLKSFGFSNRTRTNSGWVVTFDSRDAQKIHQLVENYGIHNLNERALAVSRDQCDLCRAAAAASGRLAIPKMQGSPKTFQLRKDVMMAD